jgi:D-psicose/D-tagatose/L-ribulose 3-epimerase
LKTRTAIHPSIWGPRWTAQEISSILERAAEIGFDHVVVPLRRFDEVDPAALSKVFQQHGIVPLNTAGVPPDADVSSTNRATRQRGIARLTTAIGLARDMGSIQINGVIYAPLIRADGPAGADAFRRSAESLGRVAECAVAAGVRLALEIVNRYETNLINTVEQGLSYLQIAAHPNLSLHLDTFHMSIEEADPVAAIKAALPRIGYFELDQSHRGYLRQGSLQLEHWVRTLVMAGYTGIVGIEAFSRSKMSPDHADALAIWRDTFDDGDRLARDGYEMIMRASSLS